MNMIYFLHLHKSAGTYLVDHARDNATLYREEMNGNPSAGGGLIPFWEWGWTEQREFLQRPDYNFVAKLHRPAPHHSGEYQVCYYSSRPT